MIKYLTLLLAIPLGLFLSKITREEKKIYSNAPYFPIILWILAILASIFYSLNETIAITLTFLFILVFSWKKL